MRRQEVTRKNIQWLFYNRQEGIITIMNSVSGRQGPIGQINLRDETYCMSTSNRQLIQDTAAVMKILGLKEKG